MHVLLTGANSFLGCHLVKYFLDTGAAVTATYHNQKDQLVRLAKSREYPALNLVQADLAEQSAYSRFPQSVDALLHVAGVSPLQGISMADMLACNVTGTSNLLQYALSASVRKIVYASSLSVHGDIKVPIVDADTPVSNPGPYGASKYLGERMFAAVADRLPCVAVRLPGVLGRGAHRAWLPTLLERIREGRDIVIFSPDAPFNNAAHVDDLARLFERLVRKEWRGFSAIPVAAAGKITVRQAVDRLISAGGRKVTVKVETAEQTSFTISSDRAIQQFKYDPMEIGAMLDRFVAESRADVHSPNHRCWPCH